MDMNKPSRIGIARLAKATKMAPYCDIARHGGERSSAAGRYRVAPD
jgi:hypothetical protein